MSMTTRNWRDPGQPITVGSVDNALDDLAATSAVLDATNLRDGSIGVEHFIAPRGVTLQLMGLPINRALGQETAAGTPPAALVTLNTTAWVNLVAADMPAGNSMLNTGDVLRWIWSAYIGDVTIDRSAPPVDAAEDNVQFRVRVTGTSSAGASTATASDDEALGIIHVASMSTGSNAIYSNANIEIPFRRVNGEWEYIHDNTNTPWGGTQVQITKLWLDARIQNATGQEADILNARLAAIITGGS